ncbi:alpha/beta hydrolase [Rhizobium deserti]|uniref:Alpha/beta hydrolase n=1 Tax=Rhizobium deserti TaxID=2547961 RepID=A0A4R5U7S7_9HYPH|nr:alpha/beta hydrolase [Rhizobium deserti]TDK30303.1 alpha/beta hydrolase [Rhizobium deserti]
MTLFLNFRTSPVGGAIATHPALQTGSDTSPLAPLNPEGFKRATADKDVLFAIHGYNNSQRDAVCKLARLDGLLKLPETAVLIGILWPGDSHAGFVSYPVEKPTASRAGRLFAQFCNREMKQAASFSFVSHSLGARVALETIRGLDAGARSACLMAAAIERNCLEKEYADAFAKTGHVYILASMKDDVLRLAFPLGNFFGHLLDPTGNPLSKALGYCGPPRAIGNMVRPWQISPDLDYDHGEYLPPPVPGVAFPDPKGTWMEPASFVRRAFNLQRQRWP